MTKYESMSDEARDRIDAETARSWRQRTPYKDGALTFFHKKYEDRWGVMTLARVSGGIALCYTLDEGHFTGLWTKYEHEPVPVEPFSTLFVSDDLPGELGLYGPSGEPIEHCLDEDTITTVDFHLGTRALDRFMKPKSPAITGALPHPDAIILINV